MGQKLIIKFSADRPKFIQIADAFKHAIEQGVLNVGDALPSVSVFCKDYGVSRDTLFKAYSRLKEEQIIESVPNKGYFVASNQKRVLLLLDTFKAYKEVLYGSYNNNISDDVTTDLYFHHYNIRTFKKHIEDNVGLYSKYIVMPFSDKEVKKYINLIPKDKLLIIDWKLYPELYSNALYQDFGRGLYRALSSITEHFSKYKRVELIYPPFTDHPIDIVNYCELFCKDNSIEFTLNTSTQEQFHVERYVAYISVSDRMLGEFLDKCKEPNLEPGVDVGILSYNDTPMKKFVYKGISVITTNFREMGEYAARFASGEITEINREVLTSVILRDSI